MPGDKQEQPGGSGSAGEHAPAQRRAAWNERRAWIVFAVLLVCAAYMTLKGLDSASLWDDEAQAAIVARNLARTGHLTGWDGRNLMAYRNGGTLRDDFRPVNPPLDMICAAASMRLFGCTTWACRFPMALAGLLSLAVYAMILRSDFGVKDPWMWTFGLGLVFLAAPLHLYFRQCRYYALSLVFSMLAFHAYRRYLGTRRIGKLMGLAVFSFFSFLANYMLCAAFLLSIGTAHFIFRPQAFKKRDWINAGVSAALFLALALPYTLHNRIWDRPDFALYEHEPWLSHRMTLFWWNLRDLGLVPCLPFPIAVAAVVIYIRFRGRDSSVATMAEWGTIGLANLLFIALLSLEPSVSPACQASIRYLVVSFPFLWGATAVVLAFLARWNRLAAVGVFGILLSCNLLSLGPFPFAGYHNRFRWLLPAYLKGIHHEYPTACAAVVKYLDAVAKKDDQVLAYPQEMNYPLMFYLGDKLRFCCLLDEKTHLPRGTIEALKAPLYVDENYPDYCVSFGYIHVFGRLPFFERSHLEGGKRTAFVYDRVTRLNIYSPETQRPEFPCQTFSPVTDFDPMIDGVYVFRKRTELGP